MDKAERLLKLKGIAEACRSCSLSASRKRLVFSDGNPDAPLMVVGEAPGRDEDESGVPFVGRCGRLLRDMLRAIGADPVTGCYITNVCLCRPPANRNPDQSEIECCSKFLRKQIEVVAPKVLVLLGRTAVKGVIPDYGAERLDDLRERTKRCYGTVSHAGIPVLVTYHPSALLRDKSRVSGAKDDFRFLQSAITCYYPRGQDGCIASDVPPEQLPVQDGAGLHGGAGGDPEGAPGGLPSLFS